MEFSIHGWTERRHDKLLAVIAIVPADPAVPLDHGEVYEREVANGSEPLAFMMVVAEAVAASRRRAGHQVLGLKISNGPPIELAHLLMLRPALQPPA